MSSRRAYASSISIRVLCAVLIALSVRVNRARAGEPAIRWDDRAECPEPESLRVAVRAALAGKVDDDVRLSLDVRRDPSGFAVHLVAQARGERFERALLADSCKAAQDAATLLVALALDPESALPEPQAATPTRPLLPGPFALHVGLLGDLGTLPGVAGGVGLGVSYHRERLLVWLDARTLFPRSTRDDASGTGTRAALWAAEVGLAAPFKLGAFRLGPSGALELGALRAHGEGVPDARTESATWAAIAAGALAEADVGRWSALRLHAQAAVPLRRPQVVVENGPDLYQPWPVVLRLTLSLAVRLRSKG